MEPLLLSFYAANDSLQIKSLELQQGLIADENWKPFQPVLDIIIARAQELDFTPILDSKGLPAPEKSQTIVLLADPPHHLAEPELFHDLIANSGLRPLGHGNPRSPSGEKQKNEICYQPILTIGYEDIMPLFTEAGAEARAQNLHIRHYNLDPRYKFLDASIWHRYVPVYPGDGREHGAVGNHFKAALDNVLGHMAYNHREGLYQTNAAKAMLEFQLRMLEDSYIIPFGEQNHARHVTPFKFHSETQMQAKADALLRNYFDAHGLREQLQWRFLLVDDYANAGISKTDGYIKMSKRKLAGHLLEGFSIDIDYPRENGRDDARSATSDIIPKCLNMLSDDKQRFDVLLLDYLLAVIPGSTEREYGYEFLQKLLEDNTRETMQYKRGPFMRYWIFPISSFPFALYDKLRQLGIDNYHELWHLSGGGDPITTPQLFRYHILNFLKQQIQEVYLDDSALARLISTYSYITDRETWSEVVEAQLGHLLAQIKVLQSYQPDDGGRDNALPGFSSSMDDHILTTRYQDILNKLSELIHRAKAPENIDALLAFIDGEPAENPISEKLANTYPQLIATLRKKLSDDYFFSTESLHRAIGQKKNARQFSIPGAKNKAILALPPAIQQIQQLIKLQLNGHWLQKLPIELASLNELKHIDLRNNKLKVFPEVLFALEGQLEYLDLRDNKLPEGLNVEAKSKKDIKALFERAQQIRPKNILEKLKSIKNTPEGLEKGINLLFQFTSSTDILPDEDADEIIGLKFRMEQYVTEYSKGRITNEEHRVEARQIFRAFRHIVKTLEEYLAPFS